MSGAVTEVPSTTSTRRPWQPGRGGAEQCKRGSTGHQRCSTDDVTPPQFTIDIRNLAEDTRAPMNRSRVLDASVRPGGSPAAVLMFLVILLWGSVAKGDGLAVRNVLVAPRDATTATVSFDVAWEHSWRRGSFHDAAWVFFKTRADGKSPWRPVRLAADKVVNPTGYGQAPGGSRLEFVVPDGEDGFHGVFLRRAEEGIGPVAANRVTVVLDVATIPESPRRRSRHSAWRWSMCRKGRLILVWRPARN